MLRTVVAVVVLVAVVAVVLVVGRGPGWRGCRVVGRAGVQWVSFLSARCERGPVPDRLALIR